MKVITTNLLFDEVTMILCVDLMRVAVLQDSEENVHMKKDCILG
jgi:hypothetical protein